MSQTIQLPFVDRFGQPMMVFRTSQSDGAYSLSDNGQILGELMVVCRRPNSWFRYQALKRAVEARGCRINRDNMSLNIDVDGRETTKPRWALAHAMVAADMVMQTPLDILYTIERGW